MKKILYITALLFSVLVMGQDANQNYTKAITYRDSLSGNPLIEVTYYDGLGRPIQNIAHQQSNSGKDIITHMEYDIYGRQIKEFLPFVNQTASLSYNSNAATDLLNFYNSAAYDNTSNPYSEKLLENSPAGRVFKQAAPGNEWALNPAGNDHSIKLGYDTNIANEVKFYDVSLLWNGTTNVYDPSLVHGSGNEFYLPNELYKTITKDENWTSGLNNTTEEFKDKEGKVILKRTYNNGEKHETYYVYDVYGNLTYVIPPLADGLVDDEILSGLCYQYKYDYRNRMVEKKLPGKDWEFIVYDRLDRVVATGPALNPFGGIEKGWLITKYDAFNRVAYTGWFDGIPVSAADRNTMNSHYLLSFVNEVRVQAGTFEVDDYTLSYSNKVFPDPAYDYKLLTINYYDSYNYEGGPTVPGSVLSGQQPVYFNNTIHPKGLVTGVLSRILTNASEHYWEKSYTYYDSKSRPVSTHALNEYYGGYTQTASKLDFSGKTLATETRHKYSSSSSEHLITDTFEYTAQDRLLLHKQSTPNNYDQLISKNTYDALGQLTSKNVGGWDVTGSTGLQKVDYKYNIRGWLKSINDITDNVTENDLFAFKINYNTVENAIHGTIKPLFNGNISETFWLSTSDNVVRKYGYQYDNLNRLTGAVYQKPNSLMIIPNSYNEDISYDKNGNITSLWRNGDQDSDQAYVNAVDIDQLAYTYDDHKPNQLVKVMDISAMPQGFKDDSDGITDAEKDYNYDAFGNMTSDANKAIDSITYNHLNLPVSIVFGNGNSINYIYTATGQKMQKNVIDLLSNSGGVTDYLAGGFQYKDGQLKFFPHAEGYVNVTYGGRSGTSVYYDYVFNYTDHLGNIRMSYAYDFTTENVKILEETHYYPFGLKHTNYNSDVLFHQLKEEEEMVVLKGPGPTTPAGPFYKYKFNGKEWQDELGLNMYDYGARGYMPDIGRTTTLDPLAEKFYSFSPQSFLNNNPLTFIDPTGMAADGWIKSITEGQTSYTYDASVNTVDDAKAAGYDNVADVQQGYNIFATNGSYSYNLNQDGSVTNGNGTNATFSTPIKDGIFTVGGSMTTPGGNTINTTNLGSNPFNSFPKASGAIEQMDFSSPFFPAGMIFKSLSAAAAVPRVFWSGGGVAKNAAAEFAVSNGMKTLEMTTAGRFMNTVSPYLPRTVTNPIWNNLSSNFAKGASGEVNFFTTVAGPRPSSIWLTVEQPILQSNGVNIITNVAK